MFSETYGKVSMFRMFEIIKERMTKNKGVYNYKITVGTDSQDNRHNTIVFIVAVEEIGHGGFFFRDVKKIPRVGNFRTKIWNEAIRSRKVAELLKKFIAKNDLKADFEVHVDIGKKGKTSELINEITGFIRGAGFICKIKPESYTASCIADKYSK